MNVKKLLLLAGLAVTTGLTVKAQTADEIIVKHIEAMGGNANWNKINSIKLSGSASMGGMDMAMSQTTVNDKGMRMDMSMMGINGYTIITPTEGWMYMPVQPGMDKVTPLPADQVKASQGKLKVKSGLLLDKSAISKAEYIGKDTINQVGCYKLKVTDKDGTDQTAYFDATTYYLVRLEVKLKMQDEEQEVALNYSNFQKQPEGIVYPMVLGSSQGDFTIKTIEINKPVDASVFKPADAIDTKK
jgi:hypothetical protein